MEQSYEEDKFIDTNANGATTSSWTPLLRQIFVCSGITSYFFIYGLFFGAPTVFIPQIRKEANSTEALSMQTVSWLFSISSYGSLPWTIIFPIIAKRYGRKVPYIILWINTLICVSLFYFSTSVTELLISGFLQGMCPAVQIAVSTMVLTEYTSPKYRGMFISFQGATVFWGIWISNAIGTFYHWKNIGILIFICCLYSISILFWPESPVWLAAKGRFAECAKSHRWLKGEGKDSEEELKQLIIDQKKNARQERQLDKEKNYTLKLFISIKGKRFYKPLTLSVLALCLYHFSGKLACTGYVIDIIKSISVNESTAYVGMLVLDGVTVLGMYIGVFLTKLFKRRTLLLSSATIGVMFLFILSTYLYLVHLNIVSENKYLTLFLLAGFSVTISCGPMIMSMCLASEMTPLKSRSLYLCIFALLSSALMGTVLKLFPYLYKYLNSHGTFLFFAIVSSIFIYILYKLLPETKDKTMLEIEKYFLGDDNILTTKVELMNLKETCTKDNKV
ncbi:sugar transporter ERD6-like 15 isoform X3 [Maniola jurtina]|uniref:sugar transporter ERD6-like 15 isoform X3 n=1 Tax=Maniola jurtina TaxID=191418 RepID=UPI001E688BBF|nr:sugar transporter ERD6-like 15 isoform X3 [Maniola jurtina]